MKILPLICTLLILLTNLYAEPKKNRSYECDLKKKRPQFTMEEYEKIKDSMSDNTSKKEIENFEKLKPLTKEQRRQAISFKKKFLQDLADRKDRKIGRNQKPRNLEKMYESMCDVSDEVMFNMMKESKKR